MKRRIKKSWGWLVVDESHDESAADEGIKGIITSGCFPSVRSGDGVASMNSKGRRLKETLAKVRVAPINLARGHRTVSQQDRAYGKVFEENSRIVKQSKREKKVQKKSENGRFDLVGQIPREALLEAARETGRSVSEIFEDPDHVKSIAKRKGYLNS